MKGSTRNARRKRTYLSNLVSRANCVHKTTEKLQLHLSNGQWPEFTLLIQLDSSTSFLIPAPCEKLINQ